MHVWLYKNWIHHHRISQERTCLISLEPFRVAVWCVIGWHWLLIYFTYWIMYLSLHICHICCKYVNTEKAHKTVTGTKSIYNITTYTKQVYNIHLESNFRLYISLCFKRKIGKLQNIPKNTYWRSAVLLSNNRPLRRSYKKYMHFSPM